MGNSGFSRQISEDEGSFSIASEAYSPKPVHSPGERGFAAAEGTPLPLSQHKVITMKHQDTVDTDSFLEESTVEAPPSYQEVIRSEASVTQPDIQEKQVVAIEPEAEVILPDLNESVETPPSIDPTPEIETNGLDLNVDNEFTMPTYSSSVTTTNGVNGSDTIVGDGDDISLDATVNVTSTDRELEDEVGLSENPSW